MTETNLRCCQNSRPPRVATLPLVLILGEVFTQGALNGFGVSAGIDFKSDVADDNAGG